MPNSSNKNKGCFALFDRVVEEIQFDIEQIDRLFASYAALFDRVRLIKPDLVETTAVASVLHSFYNGLEFIFLSIAKRIDRQVPSGERWHRKLLFQMTQSTTQRSAVISAELAQELDNYLSFRHFYRHSYSFFLDWSELEKLVIPMQSVWSQAKAELDEFVDRLSST